MYSLLTWLTALRSLQWSFVIIIWCPSMCWRSHTIHFSSPISVNPTSMASTIQNFSFSGGHNDRMWHIDNLRTSSERPAVAIQLIVQVHGTQYGKEIWLNVMLLSSVLCGNCSCDNSLCGALGWITLVSLSIPVFWSWMMLMVCWILFLCSVVVSSHPHFKDL